MEEVDQLLEWAEQHAENLTKEMEWRASDGGWGGYWQATDAEAKGRIRARAAAALDLLERVAGVDSRWAQSAHAVFENNGDNQSMESGARAIGDVLAEWTRQVRSGQIVPLPVEAAGARKVASTDLMEQVRALNSDRTVIPAAPIVLAGAALEIALRSAVEERGLVLSGTPSITSYARSLRSAEVLTKQDMKDVEQMAGLRNAAAHGHHEDLSAERAGLMEQQVNLFLQRLRDLLRA